MTITVVNKQAFEMINEDVKQALKQVETKYGIVFTFDRGIFSNGSSGEMKYKFVTQNEDGEASLDATTERFIKARDLVTDGVLWAGKQGLWKITSYNTKARKYPVTVKNDLGQGFRIPSETAQILFGKFTAKYPAPIPAPTAGSYSARF